MLGGQESSMQTEITSRSLTTIRIQFIADIREENETLKETEQENENEVEEANDHMQMTYDPTRDGITDILLVGGTNESYEAPEIFEEAWNNENLYLRDK